jgi:hypothetical protein
VPYKYIQAHPRTRGRLLTRYGVGTPEKTGFTMNVSEAGAFVRTNQVHQPGTRLAIEFSTGDKSVSVSARVMWAKKVPPQMAQVLLCGMGLRFVNPGPEWQSFYREWSSRR